MHQREDVHIGGSSCGGRGCALAAAFSADGAFPGFCNQPAMTSTRCPGGNIHRALTSFHISASRVGFQARDLDSSSVFICRLVEDVVF